MDLVYIAIGILFFAVAGAYVVDEAELTGSETEEQAWHFR